MTTGPAREIMGRPEVVKPGLKEIRMTDERQVTMIMPGEVPAVQAPSRIPDQPCVDCLDQSPAAERSRRAAPRRVAFWLLAFVFAATMLGTTLPTPLYDIYQAQWRSAAWRIGFLRPAGIRDSGWRVVRSGAGREDANRSGR